MAIWASETARNNYDCPKCKAPKGQYCRTPKGRIYYSGIGGIHGVRLGLLTQSELKLSEVKMMSVTDIVNDIIGRNKL